MSSKQNHKNIVNDAILKEIIETVNGLKYGYIQITVHNYKIVQIDKTDNVYTFGGNWYFNKWAFLQVNYELKDETGKEIKNNGLIGQLTLQF